MGLFSGKFNKGESGNEQQPISPEYDQNNPETINSLIQGYQQPQQPKQQNSDVEYLFIEENPFALKTERPTGSFGPFPMRNNSDKLCYGTGAMYLAGLSSGGIYGFFRGLRMAKGRSFKLKMNSILNMTTRYGPFLGNSFGVMTMGWALLDIGIEQVRGGKTDYYNHISSAFLSGLLFKSTAGVRPAVVTGSLMAGAVGLYGLISAKEDQEVIFSKMPTTNEQKTMV